MARTKGTVRRGQLITTYGVGALVAVKAESFMVAGLEQWRAGPEHEIHEPRLERLLNVGRFKLPPAGERSEDVPVVRFPKWYSCPTCNRLERFAWFSDDSRGQCPECECQLVPSRFVVCCENGHIDDFPYFRWLHAGGDGGHSGRHEMRISATGKTASLRDVVLSCSCGIAPASLEGAFERTALQQIGVKCTGRRPWLAEPAQSCSLYPRTLQRGASNVWYSIVRSSLSIPPWSEAAYRAINRRWDVLQYVREDGLAHCIEGMGIANGTRFSVEDLVLAVKQRKSGEQVDLCSMDGLKLQEYEALCRGQPAASRDDDFVCEPAARNEFVGGWFDDVMVVKRLREVRALEAFTRVTPWVPGDSPERRAQLSGSALGWLPAIEVSGEGVFFRINAERLREWEGRVDVSRRLGALAGRLAAHTGNPDNGYRATPRFVLVHSMAHALIAQWSLECGYPAASLRERLYVSQDMAAFMIYTATTDSAGSLGGIVGQAEPTRLESALKAAIASSAWCSSDPLCIECDSSGVSGLNRAACHACLLLPETCCEESNLMLDRATLVGTALSPMLGFFAHVSDGGV